ncbi:glycosyltransferase family 4 protein [Agarivorans aestuarii]|uniref:Glycosyltransferase family 4 protein n=1 Tax=Agarivorans aestuarii TaxID=1563703 RepID=A0ABU7G8Z3_9ALTE|nr:glycosyltransferase family 4 protein [Agarivorans aestuarii]MEE1675847.1 glycosyltransferase family 4 protein [Agarivorans aestuarii]
MRAYQHSTQLPPAQAVWLFIDSQTVGGIESHVANLALALHQRGHNITVVFWRAYACPHPMLEQLNSAAVPWLILDGSVGSLLHACNDFSPKLVHSHGYKASLIARLLRCIKPTKLVSSFHAGEVSQGRLACYDWLDRYTACLSQARIAISQDIAKRVAASSIIVNNFVQVPKAASSSLVNKRRLRIGFVGRLTKVKGPDRFYQLSKAMPELDFVVFGEGTLQPNEEYKNLSNLSLRGKQNSMDNCWQEMDLLCMPSRNEGLPLAALEAMSRGIPVIANNVGALSELIQHQQNGFLLKGVNIEQWQRTIKSWQSNPHLQQGLAEQARKTIQERYSPEAVIPQFEQVYEQLVPLSRAKASSPSIL